MQRSALPGLPMAKQQPNPTASQQPAPQFGQQPGSRLLAQQAQRNEPIATPPDQQKTPAPLYDKDNSDPQPQYRLTGHAVAFEEEDRANAAGSMSRVQGGGGRFAGGGASGRWDAALPKGRRKPDGRSIHGWTSDEVMQWMNKRDQEDAKAAMQRRGYPGTSQTDREQGQRTGRSRYDSMRDARALDAAERKQHNARTDVDHRTFRERQREADPKWDNRSAARKRYDGLGKLADAAPQRFGELADKAPGGIQKALVEGAKGTGQAFKGLGHEYATNKDLQKYTGVALGAGLAPVAAALAPEAAAAVAPYAGRFAQGARAVAGMAKGKVKDAAVAATGAAIQNQDKINKAADVAMDFMNPMPPAKTVLGTA